MSYQLDAILQSCNGDDLRSRIQRLIHTDAVRLRRLWNYYRNPTLPAFARDDSSASDRPYRQAQEWGLPARITGVRSGSLDSDPLAGQTIDEIARKEVVIENDIGWRIDTMVDFLFGKGPIISASNPQIEGLLNLILAHNGGIQFLQQLAVMGAVYGFVDVLVKFDGSSLTPGPITDGAGPSERTPGVEPASVLPAAEPAPRDTTTPTHDAQNA